MTANPGKWWSSKWGAGVDFAFSPDPHKQPQVFKYVGVPGVDKPRVVQVGVAGRHLPGCR